MKTLNYLVPDVGKILYNGEVYSECVSVGALDSEDNWREVPREQYEAWLAEQEAKIAADLEKERKGEDVEFEDVEGE